MTLRERLSRLLGYARVLSTPADLARYLGLRVAYARGRSGAPRTLRLRALGGAAVWCRPTADVVTLKDTFLQQFHLPPVALPPAPTILDLGSNVGYTVAHFAHLYPDARVVGVEMDEANLELARRNTARYGTRVRLLHAAVWHRDELVRYAGRKDDAFRVNGNGAEENGRRVRAMRVDRILDDANLARVDYVKMDIEGAEGVVLAEPLDWLERVEALKLEYPPPVSAAAIRQALEARGFETWNDRHHPTCICAVRRAGASSPASTDR